MYVIGFSFSVIGWEDNIVVLSFSGLVFSFLGGGLYVLESDGNGVFRNFCVGVILVWFSR